MLAAAGAVTRTSGGSPLCVVHGRTTQGCGCGGDRQRPHNSPEGCAQTNFPQDQGAQRLQVLHRVPHKRHLSTAYLATE
uniref:Uncharacterized protein n=1 Tax=Rangifer tarandus platyrhynchus TaxID=3082113 RepID=A0ACB0EDA7_RANTA|nr:unnamed protein product [Rangifer tarandus platyrhynchus]